jgi:hypothetical protein
MWMSNMNGVIEIEDHAFHNCTALSDVEFDKLEITGYGAFFRCESLRSINMPSVRRIGNFVFEDCGALTDAVFGQELGRIEGGAFLSCTALRRIAIPLKDGLIGVWDGAFRSCIRLSRLDVVGGIHNTISSLHMETWRDEMNEEIESVNRTLPDAPSGWEKTVAIQQWIESVIDRIEHYKTEHRLLLMEAMTLLELALWKAKLLDEEGRKCEAEEKMSQKAKVDKEGTRNEHRVSGANIVIKNVLPFLQLK